MVSDLSTTPSFRRNVRSVIAMFFPLFSLPACAFDMHGETEVGIQKEWYDFFSQYFFLILDDGKTGARAFGVSISIGWLTY